jgi:hypothetical protein
MTPEEMKEHDERVLEELVYTEEEERLAVASAQVLLINALLPLRPDQRARLLEFGYAVSVLEKSVPGLAASLVGRIMAGARREEVTANDE